MGIITTIEAQGKHVVVYVDGSAFVKLSKDEFEKLPLREGEEVEEAAYLDRLCALQGPKAYEAALKMLGRRDMTAGEMRAALRRKNVAAPLVESTVARLTENRLIDDARYAGRFVELRANAMAGRYAVRQKLKAKGVGDEAIEATLAALSDEQQIAAAKALAARLIRRYQGQEARAVRAKLSQALARRGFSWDVISGALEGLSTEEW